MTNKTMPTPGPWQVQDPHQPWDDDERAVFVTGGGKPGTQQVGLIAACCRTSFRDDHAEDAANARLIAAAGTAAHEVAQMGYDPVKAVRALPDLLRMAQFIRDARSGHEDRYAREVLRQHDDNAKAALARAAEQDPISAAFGGGAGKNVGQAFAADQQEKRPQSYDKTLAQQGTPDSLGHITRFSDSTNYDEKCVLCGTTDGRYGHLDKPCPNATATQQGKRDDEGTTP